MNRIARMGFGVLSGIHEPGAGWIAVSAICIVISGCGDGDSGPSTPAGGTDGVAGSGGSAGQPTGTGGAAQATGGSGTILMPPNPRTDIGPADGVLCDLEVGNPSACAVGQKCCGREPFARSACEDASSPCDCPECLVVDNIACDGPEDCPGELCCAFEEGASATQKYGRVECAPACQDPGQAVVCKDPRDCLREGAYCIESATGVAVSVCD